MTAKGPLDFDDLVLLMGGHTASQLLWAGVELGVFSTLHQTPNLNRTALRQKLGIERRPMRILMTGLTALRLLIKEGETYRNSAIANKILVKDTPGNWVDVLGWQHHIVYPGQLDLVESLRQNTNVGLRRFPGGEDNLGARLSHDRGLEKIFHDAMSSLSKTANALLIKNVDLSRCKHLVDAGGGDGTNAIALAKAFPGLQVTIFDVPTVCEIAASNIRAAGLQDRIDTHPGDFFIDPFPNGIDAILFAHMMTMWSPEKDVHALRRAHAALPVGGQVIVFNMVGWDDETGPMTAALGSPYFLSVETGEGMLYTWKEYEGFLSAAGFRKTQRTELPDDHGVLIGTR